MAAAGAFPGGREMGQYTEKPEAQLEECPCFIPAAIQATTKKLPLVPQHLKVLSASRPKGGFHKSTLTSSQKGQTYVECDLHTPHIQILGHKDFGQGMIYDTALSPQHLDYL